MTKFYFIIFLFCVIHNACGIYFHMGEKEKKCFIEELPEDTMLTASYTAELLDRKSQKYIKSSPGMGMHVEVRDPNNKVILAKTYGAEGKFYFTTHTPGEQQICIHSNSSKWSLFAGDKLRIYLDIQIGEHTNDYTKIAQKEKMTELQLRVRQLLDQVTQIQKEQNYQRVREATFRTTSETTNSRVLWWSLAQTCVLILAGVWQMRHLKGFFEAKKLV